MPPKQRKKPTKDKQKKPAAADLEPCGIVGRITICEARKFMFMFQLNTTKPIVYFKPDGSPQDQAVLCTIINKGLRDVRKKWPADDAERQTAARKILREFMHVTALEIAFEDLDLQVRQNKAAADAIISKNKKLAELLADSKSDSEFRQRLLRGRTFSNRRVVSLHLLRGNGSLRGRKEAALAFELYRTTSGIADIVGGVAGLMLFIASIAASVAFDV